MITLNCKIKHFDWTPALHCSYISTTSKVPGAVASAWHADGRGFNHHVGQNILSWKFGHENISTAIHSLTPIQEGQLTVTKH